MIVGFAHLTQGGDRPNTAVSKWTAQGWTVAETHQKIKSAPEKWPLLARRPKFHDLHLLQGTPAVEVVMHETGAVTEDSRIFYELGQEDVQIRARDVIGEIALFRDGLGFKEQCGGRLELNSRFPQWTVALSIIKDDAAPLDPSLDLDGLTCLAFYSTNPVEDAARLSEHGGRALTAPFEVNLNGRRMLVLMLRSPEGTIIELIKVQKKS